MKCLDLKVTNLPSILIIMIAIIILQDSTTLVVAVVTVAVVIMDEVITRGEKGPEDVVAGGVVNLITYVLDVELDFPQATILRII